MALGFFYDYSLKVILHKKVGERLNLLSVLHHYIPARCVLSQPVKSCNSVMGKKTREVLAVEWITAQRFLSSII